MRRGWRVAIVAILGALELAALIVSLVDYERPSAQFGYNVATNGTTIVAIEPGQPAERSGMKLGDEIVYETFPLGGRLSAIWNLTVAPGTPLKLQVRREGKVLTLTMRGEELPPLFGAGDLIFALSGFALGAIGLALVLLRPSRMTWGFALVAPPLIIPEAIFVRAQQAAPAEAVVLLTAVSIAYALQTTGMLMFASRFPNDAPRGIVGRTIDRLAVPLGAVVCGLYFYVVAALVWSNSPPHYWALFAQDYAVPTIQAAGALVAFIATYATTSGNVRSRLTPAIVSFALLIFAGTFQAFADLFTSSVLLLGTLNLLYALATILVATSVAYGVIRHRVIDVDFIISRTLVYTILTVFVVAVFALIEYVIGKLLERGRLAELLELAAAVGVGISMNYLHGWLDRFLDVVLFRRRHEAEVRLATAAQTLPHATSAELVDELLVTEPADALDLASAAVFRRNGERYTRGAAQGWGATTTASLDPDDRLVVRLRAELQPVSIASVRWPRTDLPAGEAQPVYAVPVLIGHQLEAVAIYGGHNGGEDLDPDECKSLRGLAGGAALAYDHLAEHELRRRIEALTLENESLRGIERKLTEMLEQRLNRPGDP